MGEYRSHYMLRRNLPLWKPMETIVETIEFCKDTGIDEIVWKIDAEEFNHGFTPIEMIKEFAAWLDKARKLQADVGIVLSINPWLTTNHIGRGRYFAEPPEGFRWRVLPDGHKAAEMACPLSIGWRNWLLEAYRIYATIKPDKLWIEDDFKTFAHHACNLGCYCDEHLSLFSERIGQKADRETLIARMLRPGTPDPVRAEWLDFQGQIMVGVCLEIEQIVHGESPRTRLGLMQSWSTDGRWWAEAIQALAGNLQPLARTSLAPYVETRATDFLPDRADILKEIQCIPADTENCPELENCMYTPYAKSTRVTRLQIALSQAIGCPSITMNLFDMLGTPIHRDPRMGKMLKESKPLFDAIAGIAGPNGRPRGVSIPFNKRYADAVYVEEDRGLESFLFDGEGWAMPLQGSGMPIVINGDGCVTAATGQSLRSFERQDIERMLAGGVLLDGSAAAAMQEMGYGEFIGVKPGSAVSRDAVLISAERDDWAGQNSEDPAYMSLREAAEPSPCRIYPFKELALGARTVSMFVDPDHQAVMPGFVTFENALGGRVAVYPLGLSRGTMAGFMNWQRREQLQRVVRWLGRENVDLIVDGGAWMMPVRRDFDDYVFAAVLNLETDPWEEVTLTFDWRRDGEPKIEIVDSSGRLNEIAPSKLVIDEGVVFARLGIEVLALDVLAMRIS